MSAAPATNRRAARLVGAAVLVLGPAVAPPLARAQDATGAALPPGLPPSAEILNGPTAGMPPLLLGTPGDARYLPGLPNEIGPRTPIWSFTPSIGAAEMFNDNIFQTNADRRADLITAVTPGLEVHGDTPRVKLDLRYAPTLELYARTGSADAVAQQLLGTGIVTLIPDTLFVDARALAAVQPSGGGLGGLGESSLDSPIAAGGADATAPGALVLGKDNRAQTTSFSITPYVVHRFSTFGTAKFGVTLTHSTISGESGGVPIPGTVPLGTQTQQTAEATAQFQTGEAFGRVRDFVLLDASRSTGSGVLSGARNDIATNWLGYQVNRFVTPFAELGAESISYNTAPPFKLNDAVWELGVLLTPNPDSRLSIGYGHHQGIDSLAVQGFYALSARTRLTASYTTALATDVQQIQAQLGMAEFDPLGNAVDVQTGAPLFLGTGLLGTQNGLFRNRTLALTATTRLDRDTISLTVQRQQQTPIGNAAAAAGGGIGQNATTFMGSWRHQVSERTTLGASASYTLTTFQTTLPGNERFVAATAGVSYRLSETLSTVARYSFFNRNSDFAGRSFVENVILIGVTKKF